MGGTHPISFHRNNSNAPEVRTDCQRRGIELVATRRGPHPHKDGGVEVRRIFHKLRSQSIEPFNG